MLIPAFLWQPGAWAFCSALHMENSSGASQELRPMAAGEKKQGMAGRMRLVNASASKDITDSSNQVLRSIIQITDDIIIHANNVPPEDPNYDNSQYLSWIFSVSKKRIRGYVEWSYQNDKVTTFLIKVGKETVAYLIYKDVEDDGAKKIGVIEYLAVSPEFRENGAARLLLKAAIALAKEKGKEILNVYTWNGNVPARGFYERMGGITETNEDKTAPGDEVRYTFYLTAMNEADKLPEVIGSQI
jgi:ribosomal protein S18 acetylase RimI-like enzyme